MNTLSKAACDHVAMNLELAALNPTTAAERVEAVRGLGDLSARVSREDIGVVLGALRRIKRSGGRDVRPVAEMVLLRIEKKRA